MAHGAADLHFHSTRSDGAFEPAELMAIAAERGLELVSLTDHDTFAGVGEANEAATKLGVRLVQGIEISTHYKGAGLHLLAYWDGFGTQSADFDAFLEARLEGRRVRLQRMADALAKLGVTLDVDEVLRTANGAVTRSHIAKQLVAQGAARTIQEVFDRWIGSAGPAYVASEQLPVEQMLARVRSEGGLPVVAHPGSQKLTHEDLRTLRDAGLGGVEIHHPSHPRSTRRRYRRSCRELGLVPTGGSDWHGRHGSSLLGRGHGLSLEARHAFEEALASAS
ncbi:MAG: PHP domain-containing protein [Proteobacteria bacterium]|nr:PHP domain-containing protein [Pseudomonadota bacterium]